MAGDNRLTNIEFLKLSDILRNNQEEVQKTCCSNKEVATYLRTKTDIKFADSSIASMLDAISLKLEKIGKSFSNQKKVHNTKVITLALLNLMDKLGEKLPPDLLEVYEKAHGHPFKPTMKPQPMSSVIDPKTLNVVKPKS